MFISRRFRSVDCRSFLDHAKSINKRMSTPSTMGSLYEYLSKEILAAKLNMTGLKNCGGAGDEGLDILGKWDLKAYYNMEGTRDVKLSSVRLHLKLIRPILKSSLEYLTSQSLPLKKSSKSLENSGKLLIQCKNTKSQITAKTIRELAGIYFYHVRTPKDAKNSFMVLVAAKNLTKQARVQFDNANFPLVYCRVLPLSLIDFDADPYDINNWEGGELKEFYCNIYANQMLGGLNIEVQVNDMIKRGQMEESEASGSTIMTKSTSVPTLSSTRTALRQGSVSSIA